MSPLVTMGDVWAPGTIWLTPTPMPAWCFSFTMAILMEMASP